MIYRPTWQSEKSHYQQMADKLSGDSKGGYTVRFRNLIGGFAVHCNFQGSQTKGTLGTGGQNTFGTGGGEGQQ